MPELRSPHSKADAAEVRKYLQHVLRERGFSQDKAERIAAKWTVGTGRELRTYTVSMYQHIFGHDEEGWAVYIAAKSQIGWEDLAKLPSARTKCM